MVSGCAFELTKFYTVAKAESSVGVRVSLTYQLAVKHSPVFEISVGERAAISIFVLPDSVDVVKHQPNGFSFDRAARELFGILAEALDDFFRVDGLGRVDANQPYFFVRAHHDCVTVDDANHFSDFAVDFIDFRGLR